MPPDNQDPAAPSGGANLARNLLYQFNRLGSLEDRIFLNQCVVYQFSM